MNSPRDFQKLAALIFSSFLCTLIVSAASVPALAQQSTPSPTIPSTGFAGLDQYRASRIAVYTNDFGQLARYREADAALKPPAPGENRVVFFGDSITDIWHLNEYFPGKPYINRGIGGQTTAQMLLRFYPDVIALQPKAVVIFGGTNDIAGNLGAVSMESIQDNLAAMADIARANGIKVIMASVMPVCDLPGRPPMTPGRPPESILALNRWIKNYVSSHNAVYLDYFSVTVDDKGMLRADMTEDGLHPTVKGYDVMNPLAEKAIAQALGK